MKNYNWIGAQNKFLGITRIKAKRCLVMSLFINIYGVIKQKAVYFTSIFVELAKAKKDASSVKKELISMFKPIKECVKTITADNGKEFAEHEAVARVIEADYYFAHPYSSCE